MSVQPEFHLHEVESDVADALRRRLDARTSVDPDFWSFSHLRSRSGNHALFQYPAMMVPELQGALLDDLRAVSPGSELVYDPFAGSGTVMLESLYRGLEFHGSDINPLAILNILPYSVCTICKSVSGMRTGAVFFPDGIIIKKGMREGK